MTTTQEQILPGDSLVMETGRQGRREAEAFRDYLKQLPEKRWLNKSFCSDWTIRDVAKHQAAQGWVMRDMVLTTIKGNSFDGLNFQAIEERAAELEGLNRLELADRLVQVTHEMYDALERATPEQLDLSAETRFGRINLAFAGSLRLSELSLHSWDVRVVEDLTAKVSRGSLPLLFPGLVAALPGLVHSPTVKQLATTTYQFEISGSVKGPLSLSLEQGKVRAKRDYAEKADVTLKLDSEAFLRLSWGRLKNLEWMIRDGWVKVEGDKAAALKLSELFQGR